MSEEEKNKDATQNTKDETAQDKKEIFLYSCPMCNKDTYHESGLKLWCEDCHTPIVEYD